ncbi:MAG: hypothetical protein AMJ90_01340 [candidate division Zixibacteria bacterium SM23_73_2]|nr:MAG: hypothetical protein AMJ90_01340 [candidate division Zixibacteria bacterium SM23_73_2]
MRLNRSVLLPELGITLIFLLVLSFTVYDNLYSEGFLCGDADTNGEVNLSDVLYIANYCLKGGLQPVPLQSADVNCDGEVNLSDVIYLANYLLKSGSPPCWFEVSNTSQGCKTFQKIEGDIVPPDQDCIEYTYDEESVLSIKHLNAGFNCCPEKIKIFVNIQNSIITIEEKEYNGLCDCNCLFDLDFDIENVVPGEFTIKVIEPYLPSGDQLLEFYVDLSYSTSGIFCVERTCYPWGDW